MLKLSALLLFVWVSPALAQTVVVDGSSTVYPITEAVAEEFQKEYKGKYKVTVGTKGTGGGFKRFCRGETDVQNASRPILKLEFEACKETGIKFIELPIAYDATVVVVHPKNEWIKEITVEELKKIWEPSAQGKVTKWNQINPKWPDQTFKLFGAGSDSGTFDYFTEAIVGKAKASRGDYTASEDDNTLVQGVSQEKNAIGYIPMAYYMGNTAKLKAVGIITKDKKGKVPSGCFAQPQNSRRWILPTSGATTLYLHKPKGIKQTRSERIRQFLYEECCDPGAKRTIHTIASGGL
jgi:phosphate transport system substrate-binding protein